MPSISYKRPVPQDDIHVIRQPMPFVRTDGTTGEKIFPAGTRVDIAFYAGTESGARVARDIFIHGQHEWGCKAIAYELIRVISLLEALALEAE